jgi:glycosyltransferase involved in cell wall biosynthesis
MDRDLRLIVVGGQGWKTSPIFRQLRELGIENRVHFAGYLEDSELPAFFGVCEAFVFPSLYEGFGMPILEAMACGALVLTSDRGAMKEVAGDAAGYFDPEDPRSIADAIEKFVVRGEGREELVARGRERARMFTWESAADKVMEVLRGMA